MSNDWMLEAKSAAAHAALVRLEHEAEAGASGAFVGFIVGAGAGLPGAVPGAILGAIVGTLAGVVAEANGVRQEARVRELDEQIGISAGTLGAPNLQHPPSMR